MKKSIFLSVLALAAVVSCQKSEIVDSKYGNDAIGFETYAGRDAMTKATVADETAIKKADYSGIALYGFYTGAKTWASSGDNTIANPAANLWAGEPLKWDNSTSKWNTTGTKYWTNENDNYSFLAYAPHTNTNIVAELDANSSNPTVKYTVDPTLTNQIDLLYAEPIFNTSKGANASGVALTMKHALSRIAVKASESHDQYTYTIQSLSLAGNFVKTNTFNLKTASWDAVTDQTTKESGSYSFVLPNNAVVVNSETPESCVGDNYLMIIPVKVTDAILTVTYTTTYGTGDAAIVSKLITKTVKVTADFQQGKAYVLNIAFAPNPYDAISFTVSVTDWVDNTLNSNNQPKNPETTVDTENII